MPENEFKIWLAYGIVLFFEYEIEKVFEYAVDDLQTNAKQYISFFRRN